MPPTREAAPRRQRYNTRKQENYKFAVMLTKVPQRMKSKVIAEAMGKYGMCSVEKQGQMVKINYKFKINAEYIKKKRNIFICNVNPLSTNVPIWDISIFRQYCPEGIMC